MVPTEVSEEETTVALREVPVSDVAAAVIVMSAEPSKATPLMFFVAANFVAVEALPVRAPVNEVDDTDDRPEIVVAELPNEIAVVPMVTDELVRLELPILVSVLAEPEIVLLVRVCAVLISAISPAVVPPIVLPST